MGKVDQSRLRVRWQGIKKNGYPPKDEDPFYGGRYSKPVLAGNEITEQVAIEAYVWDYEREGWLPATMYDGADPGDYEVQHVSHWALWPRCKFVCLD